MLTRQTESCPKHVRKLNLILEVQGSHVPCGEWRIQCQTDQTLDALDNLEMDFKKYFLILTFSAQECYSLSTETDSSGDGADTDFVPHELFHPFRKQSNGDITVGFEG